MVVSQSDIEWRYSTTSGSEGDSETGSAGGSLGQWMSTTTIPDASLENLFPNVSAAENASGITRYRCVFVTNTGTGTWSDVRVFIDSQESDGASVSIGLDPAGVVASDSGTDQAEEISDGQTEPSGVSWSQPPDYDGGLQVGTVDGGQCFAFWLRQLVAPNTPATVGDNVHIDVRGITGAS